MYFSYIKAFLPESLEVILLSPTLSEASSVKSVVVVESSFSKAFELSLRGLEI